MTHQPLIALNNVSVYRDKILVLSNLSFQMQEGEFVYLIGKTGSGKSTLLKTLYAELLIEEGEANIAGFNLSRIKRKEIPFLRRKLGIVFQDFQLLFDRTVNENLAFVMQATGWKGKEKTEKRAGEVLDMVGMPVKGFKMPHELSGGEQQRVCIARALVNQPKIILADEPTGNLDPETSTEIISLLHQINLTGTTVLVATHNHGMIEKFPARVVQMERGSVVSS
jgi:cell division transport system ATP-binding protein